MLFGCNHKLWTKDHRSVTIQNCYSHTFHAQFLLYKYEKHCSMKSLIFDQQTLAVFIQTNFMFSIGMLIQLNFSTSEYVQMESVSWYYAICKNHIIKMIQQIISHSSFTLFQTAYCHNNMIDPHNADIIKNFMNVE